MAAKHVQYLFSNLFIYYMWLEEHECTNLRQSYTQLLPRSEEEVALKETQIIEFTEGS